MCIVSKLNHAHTLQYHQEGGGALLTTTESLGWRILMAESLEEVSLRLPPVVPLVQDPRFSRFATRQIYHGWYSCL